jgi:TusA-related sulfurtransferase
MAVREALLGMDKGQILEVLGTDPASLEGIAALVKRLGGEVLRAGPKGDREWFLLIKR